MLYVKRAYGIVIIPTLLAKREIPLQNPLIYLEYTVKGGSDG